MKFLIKIGGTLIDSPESRLALAQQIASVVKLEHRVVVVHGGGKQLSSYLKEQGFQSEFRGGLRVTPPEILDAVLRILAGSVNHHLVAALQQAQVRAVGLSGIDAGMVRARQLSTELGAVGLVERVDAALLELLTSQNYVPAVACIAGGEQGEIFNVNADQMAAACAAEFRADQLIFLTDVEGVLGEDQQRIARLNSNQALELIEAGTAQGGMEAKLRAAVSGVAQGIGQIRIVSGSSRNVLERLLRGDDLGTTLVAV